MKEKIKIFYQLKLNSLFTVVNSPKAKKGRNCSRTPIKLNRIQI